ncbi:RNA polymerase sigma-70 factor (ECF subfamily) [Filimonas zeae]|uniref:DNA-directed RNA polymerase sigma-70 factor n=1 Tax=Filimonas zeae TaxID=1737353 RepID=A0A917MTW4_9BACT|nr:RNA polymerase sigma-70 factor [Filimonas zeae]MDR6339451.1 RNA polymerase sigma-70 factor (ECF subfamily) [Filimonas zeae]GGH63542.1 DNA-directed RNA polymerase sigma-70 factor [Filimonas zeae]
MSNHVSYEEKLLLAQLAADSHEAFDTFYNRYFEAVYRNVVKITGDAAVAEDLVQEVFFAFWKKRKDFEDAGHAANWLFLTSYHKSLNQLRQHARERLMKQTVATLQHNDPDDIAYLIKENQLNLLEKAVAQLPEKRKKVFELCRLQGKTYAEAAAELGISVNTVKNHLSEAGETIRAWLLQHREELPATTLLLLMATCL